MSLLSAAEKLECAVRTEMDNSCVQVCIYDDRVEITPPGMLFGKLTLEMMMSGSSKIRNTGIA